MVITGFDRKIHLLSPIFSFTHPYPKNLVSSCKATSIFKWSNMLSWIFLWKRDFIPLCHRKWSNANTPLYLHLMLYCLSYIVSSKEVQCFLRPSSHCHVLLQAWFICWKLLPCWNQLSTDHYYVDFDGHQEA